MKPQILVEVWLMTSLSLAHLAAVRFFLIDELLLLTAHLDQLIVLDPVVLDKFRHFLINGVFDGTSKHLCRTDLSHVRDVAEGSYVT